MLKLIKQAIGRVILRNMFIPKCFCSASGKPLRVSLVEWVGNNLELNVNDDEVML